LPQLDDAPADLPEQREVRGDTFQVAVQLVEGVQRLLDFQQAGRFQHPFQGGQAGLFPYILHPADGETPFEVEQFPRLGGLPEQ
jgi:hypothetical protein